jgi:hypothetical protein
LTIATTSAAVRPAVCQPVEPQRAHLVGEREDIGDLIPGEALLPEPFTPRAGLEQHSVTFAGHRHHLHTGIAYIL